MTHSADVPHLETDGRPSAPLSVTTQLARVRATMSVFFAGTWTAELADSGTVGQARAAMAAVIQHLELRAGVTVGALGLADYWPGPDEAPAERDFHPEPAAAHLRDASGWLEANHAVAERASATWAATDDDLVWSLLWTRRAMATKAAVTPLEALLRCVAAWSEFRAWLEGEWWSDFANHESQALALALLDRAAIYITPEHEGVS